MVASTSDNSVSAKELETDYVIIAREGHKPNKICGCYASRFTNRQIVESAILTICFNLCIHYSGFMIPLPTLITIEVLLLLQLIMAVDKMPGLCFNTNAYMAGQKINSIVEEIKVTKGKDRDMFKRKKKEYVVKYRIIDGEDEAYIRKVISPGPFDPEFEEPKQDDYDTTTPHYVTCVVKNNEPFSAYPRSVVELHHSRYYKWKIYFLPLLISSLLAFVLSYRFTVQFQYQKYADWARLSLIIFSMLTFIIIVPLAYHTRLHKWDVSYTGEEISDEDYEEPVHAILHSDTEDVNKQDSYEAPVIVVMPSDTVDEDASRESKEEALLENTA